MRWKQQFSQVYPGGCFADGKMPWISLQGAGFDWLFVQRAEWRQLQHEIPAWGRLFWRQMSLRLSQYDSCRNDNQQWCLSVHQVGLSTKMGLKYHAQFLLLSCALMFVIFIWVNIRSWILYSHVKVRFADLSFTEGHLWSPCQRWLFGGRPPLTRKPEVAYIPSKI